jgi:hypothetical protein
MITSVARAVAGGERFSSRWSGERCAGVCVLQLVACQVTPGIPPRGSHLPPVPRPVGNTKRLKKSHTHHLTRRFPSSGRRLTRRGCRARWRCEALRCSAPPAAVRFVCS